MGDDTMSTLKVNSLQTTSGAGLYPSKAWVCFTGSGTVSIRNSENISSLTDSGQGMYFINYSNNFSNTNYAGGGAVRHNTTDNIRENTFVNFRRISDSISTNKAGLSVSNSGSPVDDETVTFMVVGD
jgi:hypothetical protein